MALAVDEFPQRTEEPGDLIAMALVGELASSIELPRCPVHHHLGSCDQRHLVVQQDLPEMELRPHRAEPASGTEDGGGDPVER